MKDGSLGGFWKPCGVRESVEQIEKRSKRHKRIIRKAYKQKPKARRLMRIEWGFYGSPEWRKLRKEVIKKYGKVCMKCKTKVKRPNVDHILPKSLFPDRALIFENLQILCRQCNMANGANNFVDYRPK